MELITQAPRGTKDVLPGESAAIRRIELNAMAAAERFGYNEIRTPVFEHTELFERGVGNDTDVVQKEMYTFLDKGGRSITLRPEGTAGAARACIEHGLLAESLPCKVSYISTCYRYEKPQAGRYREFSQFGAECFGPTEAAADAEVIALAVTVLSDLGGAGAYSVQLNSIGCPTCRKNYTAALRAYFAAKAETLCGTCLGRLERNPMRILDCKSPICKEIAAGSPLITDYICEDCKAHFEKLQALLQNMNIPYVLNPRLVRGLDYYTRTVFEFVSHESATEGLVFCGGGRYDGLVEELGGPPTPALGFGMGIERTYAVLQAAGTPLPGKSSPEIYIAARGEAATQAARIAADLRRSGRRAEVDLMGRSLKAQMKAANKSGAAFCAVIGESELTAGKCTVKAMQGDESYEVPLASFAASFAAKQA
ncbi:MAG: histidine--tRNA ligase [Oscillospiraceae bacterium]|jgi:histidyl-tRNA synthetase|nr:histidine--tRNA ligase [Oscillospiraceae bacterium]